MCAPLWAFCDAGGSASGPVTRLTSDVEAVAETFGNGAIGVLAELVSLLVISATMVLVDRRLGLLLLLTLIPVMRIVIALQTRYRRANYRVREELGSRNADLQENLQGLEVVQMFRCQSRNLDEAMQIALIRERVEKVRKMRLASRDKGANKMANRAHQMREVNIGSRHTIATPCASSESREYLPVGLLDNRSTVSNLAFALYSTPLWTMALIASRLYLVWIATVCGKLKADFRYSNTLGWNTFPLPPLTQNNRKDLTRCAEDILLAREAHFPPPPSPSSMIPKQCPKISAMPMIAMMSAWSVLSLGDASRTIQSGWRSCLGCMLR